MRVEVSRPLRGSAASAIAAARRAFLLSDCRIEDLARDGVRATGLPFFSRGMRFLSWSRDTRVEVRSGSVTAHARFVGVRRAQLVIVALFAVPLAQVLVHPAQYRATDEGLARWLALAAVAPLLGACFAWMVSHFPKVAVVDLAETVAAGDAPFSPEREATTRRQAIEITIAVVLGLFVAAPVGLSLAVSRLAWDVLADMGHPLTTAHKWWGFALGYFVALALTLSVFWWRRVRLRAIRRAMRPFPGVRRDSALTGSAALSEVPRRARRRLNSGSGSAVLPLDSTDRSRRTPGA